MYLGIDTSNYTTSIAWFDGENGKNCSRLLDVKTGELGLRQSDALFAHVKRLPELAQELFSGTDRSSICAVGVSSRPRAVEGSYMPCFLAGVSTARTMAAALGVPYYEFSHQQGHVAAALWSAGRMDLMEKPHLAWHLSGGTTELLLITPSDRNVDAQRIGGSSDISAGQIMDRTGKLLSLAFPSGKLLDELSRQDDGRDKFKVKTCDLSFSFSGLENKVIKYLSDGHSSCETAAYAVRYVCDVIIRTTKDALKQYPGYPVVFSGGVASNSMLRDLCGDFESVFAPPCYSTDNAMGTAVLTWLQGV
jgi:N6-L-threonylcarbamoyladenine synthase